MKKLFLLFSLLIVTTAFSQRLFNYDFTANTPQLISPNIVMDSPQTSLVSNFEDYVGYFNLPIETNYDNFTVGAGYSHKEEAKFDNLEVVVGRMGSGDERWRMSLMAGYYKAVERQATYAGFSLSYHPTEHSYLGFTMKDVYDVSMEDGKWNDTNDHIFFLYEAMTPTFFAKVSVWDNNFEHISVYGDYSYNDVQKSTYTASLEFESDRLKVGAFYSEHAGAFVQYGFEWIHVYAAISEKPSVGVIFK